MIEGDIIMSKKELLKYLIENNVGISVTQILISMCITVLLSMFIYWVYKKTYSGVMYSKNFNITIMLISTVTSMVMMIIGSNLALSLGMVGALSIIRFRSAIKDPKDIGFLFWGIAVGLSTGTGIYIIGIIGSIFIAFLLFIFDRGIYNDNCYLLIVKGNDINFDKIESIIKEHTSKFNLKMKNSADIFTEATYEIKLKRNEDNEILRELKTIENIININIVSYNGEIAG